MPLCKASIPTHRQLPGREVGRLPPAPSPLALAAPRQKNDSPPFLLLGRFTLCPLPPPRLELPWLGHSDKLNITQPKLSSTCPTGPLHTDAPPPLPLHVSPWEGWGEQDPSNPACLQGSHSPWARACSRWHPAPSTGPALQTVLSSQGTARKRGTGLSPGQR